MHLGCLLDVVQNIFELLGANGRVASFLSPRFCPLTEETMLVILRVVLLPVHQ